MRKIFYYIKLKNISPITISNGNDDVADIDLLTDSSNRFFIPGTSLAGCIAHSLTTSELELFQPKIGSKEKQSPFFISNAYLSSKSFKTEIRDGIALDQEKITEKTGKYDYEILPEGYEFIWKVEIVDRDGKNYETLLETIFSKIIHHDIRIGYKTSRGLGKLDIVKENEKYVIGKKIFDQSNYDNFFKFDCDKLNHYDLIEPVKYESNYTILNADLYLNGGLSIRSYNSVKSDSKGYNYSSIQSNKNYIIPGSSWNGLFLSCFKKYNHLLQLGIDIESLFGNKMHKSKIIFDESIIDITDGEVIKNTRNRINSFTGGSYSSGLYQEETVYNGKTILTISIPKEVYTDEILSMLVLILKELDSGMIALGGETSVGRGMFKVNKVDLDGKQVNFEDYIIIEEVQ